MNLNKNFKYRMMIDFETLDTAPTAKCLSCGVVLFNKGGIWEKVYWEFDLKDQEILKRTVNEDTIKWWQKTNKEEYERLCNMERDGDIYCVSDLSVYVIQLCKEFNIKEVWSRGCMDFHILQNIMGKYFPFKYNQMRDVRTLDSLGKFGKGMKKNNHNALDDAVNQAKYVQFVLNSVWKMKGKKV